MVSPPPSVRFFLCGVPTPQCSSVLDSKQSWESAKFQLARWSHRFFFCAFWMCSNPFLLKYLSTQILGPSWVNVAQLVSPSVALPAELVKWIIVSSRYSLYAIAFCKNYLNLNYCWGWYQYDSTSPPQDNNPDYSRLSEIYLRLYNFMSDFFYFGDMFH